MKRAPLRASLQLVFFALMCASAIEAHAAMYYVTVAGLGGEPDYEQRFTAALSRVPTLADSHRGEYKPTMGMSMKKPD